MKKYLDWINKNKISSVLLLVGIVFIVVPLAVYVLSVVTVFPNGGNDWSGFWGGYLGAIIGGLFTLIVFKYTVSYNNEMYDKDKRLEASKTIIKFSSTFSYLIANA